MFRLAAVLRGGVMTPRAALKRLALSPSVALTHSSIKKAYVQQTLQCHPDLHPNDPEATDKFRSLSDALRVALRALEAHDGAAVSGAPTGAHARRDRVYDSQEALESLRQAIIAYRQHRESADTLGASSAPARGGRAAATAAEAFFTPSLEYVSAVCRQEALAMRQVRAFCAELPSVLCGGGGGGGGGGGSKGPALFEAIAFFYTRYVQSTSDCVLRFSKDLPVIVRRVVMQRRTRVRNRHTRATTGFATGDRPQRQRIEDMPMKPLVLVGALLFDLPRTAADADADADDSMTSTFGVTRASEINVADELKCTIYPSDSVRSITDKLGSWEAASYDRLKLELAIADACTFLSGMLMRAAARPGEETTDGSDRGAAATALGLAVVTHLHLSAAHTEKVLLTLQRLACCLCNEFDTACTAPPVQNSLDVIFSVLRAQDGLLPSADEVQWVRDDDRAAALLPIADLIAHCRELAALAAPVMRGSVSLTWSERSDLVQSASELLADSPKAADQKDARTGGSDSEAAGRQDPDAAAAAGANPSASSAGYLVGRCPECCAAEQVQFAVSVELSKELAVFLRSLRAALRTVVVADARARRLLPELLRLRNVTVNEEFIEEAVPSPLDVAVQDGEDAPRVKFRYRAPIHVFTRHYNMVASRELVFWQRLHEQREYVAQHAAAMSPMNVHYECLPSGAAVPKAGGAAASMAGPPVSGWIGDDADAHDGCDNALITAAELESSQAFRQWLEDVVEQSSLNSECRSALRSAGIGYVRRDPALPLANYLSFVKDFVQADAVRSVLESRGRGHARGGSSSAEQGALSPDDIGVAIIVGHHCDLRDGGQLLVPWHMDPNVLIALLDEETAGERLGLPAAASPAAGAEPGG